MKKIVLLVVTILTLVPLSFSQSIKFNLITPQPELQGSDTGDMEFVDIDNDGDPDLIITGSGNMSSGTAHSALTTVYINDGNGTLTPVGNNGIENIRNSKIGFADIDNDSDLDLLISGSTHGGTDLTKLYRNDGTGNFTEEQNTPFQSLSNGYFNFGDLDNDGDQDILFSGGNSTTSNIFKYVNNGAGSFTEVTAIGIDGINGVLELFDYDNDNDLDVLVTGEDANGNTLTGLFNNDGTGIFSSVADAGFNNFTFGDIATGDTDADGDLDVLIIGNKTSVDIETEYYINNGDGTFTWLTNTPFADVSVSGETSFNDFDNDGDLDVFIIGSGEGGLLNNAIIAHIYTNEGNHNFVLSDELIGAYLSTHAVADINNDNLPDLVLGGTTTGSPVRASFIYENITEATTSAEHVSMINDLILYPNPSNGTVQIKWDASSNAVLNLFDLSGKKRFTYHLIKGINTIQLNLPDGIYLAHIGSNAISYNQKLVVKNK